MGPEALRRLPRARLLRAVFSDGHGELSVEQSSFYGFRVNAVVQVGNRGGRPKVSGPEDDELVQVYQGLLADLNGLKLRLSKGQLVLNEPTRIVDALQPSLGEGAKWIAVSNGRIAVRTLAGGLWDVRGLTFEAFAKGRFVPWKLAREIVARFYGFSPSHLRDVLQSHTKTKLLDTSDKKI